MVDETKPTETTEDKVDEKKEEKKKDKIAEAKEAAEDMRVATRALKEENDRKERLEAERIVSGEADAGTPPPKKKEETPEEYVDKVMSGEKNE